MAGRKLTLNTRVEASTILEVVVSMVIIILVFGTGMIIFSNVTRSSLSLKKIKAEAALEETMQYMEKAKGSSSSPILITGDFSIEEDIKSYPSDSRLSQVHLFAYDNNHLKIAELQKIIISPNE